MRFPVGLPPQIGGGGGTREEGGSRAGLGHAQVWPGVEWGGGARNALPGAENPLLPSPGVGSGRPSQPRPPLEVSLAATWRLSLEDSLLFQAGCLHRGCWVWLGGWPAPPPGEARRGGLGEEGALAAALVCFSSSFQPLFPSKPLLARWEPFPHCLLREEKRLQPESQVFL